MTRLLLPVFITCLLIAGVRPAEAQNTKPITVAGGYSYLREQPPGDFPATTYDSGWAVAIACTFLWDRLGAVADFGANRKINIVDEEQTLKAYLVGARYELTRSTWLTTYAQGLVGREKFTEPGFSESGFAFQPGAGVDVFVWKGIGARAQVDYRIVKYDEATFKDWRVFLGGVVAIGW